MQHTISHETLNAVLTGVKVIKNGIETVQYRGLQYARIERRFARPELVNVGETAQTNAHGGTRRSVDCTNFGCVRVLNFIAIMMVKESNEPRCARLCYIY